MSEASPEYVGIKPEERAFRRADGYYFGERRLEPFSFLRQSAMASLLRAMGQTHPTEVVTSLWIMTQPDAAAKTVRRFPEQFVDQVDAFADENGLVLNAPGFALAQSIYDAVTTDIAASSASPEFDEENDGGDDPN